MSFQIGIVKYLSKKLKITLTSASDKEDSMGVDAHNGRIKINIKPFSYNDRYSYRDNKDIFNIFYKFRIEDNRIIINYNQLMIARKERKLRASV
jgi:hypothetical protein